MDMNGKDVRIKKVGEEGGREGGVEGDEREALLPQGGAAGAGRKAVVAKVRRKVQWNDNVGNKLVEVLEYQPSDGSDSDDERSDSCLCTIM